MNSLVAFLSPFTLLLQAVAAQLPGGAGAMDARAVPEPAETLRGPAAMPAAPFEALKQARRPMILGQVRIEQRVIIRIAPGSPAAREQMMAEMQPRGSSSTSYQEQKLDGCVAISGIAGVQPAPQQNRLLLFMRDRRVLSAALERACNARDYYSGFYIERSEDGQLCARRDLLQSRAGASCKVAQLNRLVAVRD
jgi:hypothetical protein